MEVPANLPLLLNASNDTKEVVKTILASPDDYVNNMIRLSKVCNVKIRFKHPVIIMVSRCKSVKDVTEYVFNNLFISTGGNLCYGLKSNSRRGYIVPGEIESYEPVLNSVDKFTSYEQFKNKFDTYFITEALIQQLWNETSAQHGEQYKPSDFKTIGSAGKEALRIFLTRFKGISSTDTSSYTERGTAPNTYFVAEGYYYGRGGSGSRDISISHTIGRNRVDYASEFHGCGNGTYGLVATRNTYLWLEND